HVRVRALYPKRLPLLDTKTMLLIDHHEPKIKERDAVAQQGVRAHRDAGLPARESEQRAPSLSHRHLAREQHRMQLLGELRPERLGDAAEVLRGEHLRGSQQRTLSTALG